MNNFTDAEDLTEDEAAELLSTLRVSADTTTFNSFDSEDE